MNDKKTPNPIDILVGSRVRQFRTSAGISQDKLGDQLGVTFQQVQKYEKGSNRISASMLQKIANVLQLPVAVFFEDPNSQNKTGLAEPGTGYAADFENAAETRKLSQAFNKINDPKVRKKIIELVKSMADSEG